MEAELPAEQRTFFRLRESSELAEGEYNRLMVWYPILGYLGWATFYFLITFVINAKRIVERNYDNSYRYFARSKKLRAILMTMGKAGAPFIFHFCHFLFFLLGHGLGLLCFHYKWVNYLITTFWFICCCKNGSDFYMEYFARKYEKQLSELPQREAPSPRPAYSMNKSKTE